MGEEKYSVRRRPKEPGNRTAGNLRALQKIHLERGPERELQKSDLIITDRGKRGRNDVTNGRGFTGSGCNRSDEEIFNRTTLEDNEVKGNEG